MHVTKRADRDPMAALYETSTRAPEQPDKKQTKEQRQLCMIRIKTFGIGDPAIQAALEMMKKIGEMYVKGEVAADALYGLSDDLLASQGLSANGPAKVCRHKAEQRNHTLAKLFSKPDVDVLKSSSGLEIMMGFCVEGDGHPATKRNKNPTPWRN